MKWFEGKIVAGHGVASGRAAQCPFPGGSIRMQQPFFMERGIDLTPYHPGTLNVDLAPMTFLPGKPLFDGKLRWLDDLEERFILSLVRIGVGGRQYAGLWYYPHPATKVDHFQRESVVELLLPWIDGLATGDAVRVGLEL